MNDGNNSMTSSLIASASSIADKFACSCNGSYAMAQVASENKDRRNNNATYDLNRLTSDFYANEGIHRQASFVQQDDDTISTISASFMPTPPRRQRRSGGSRGSSAVVTPPINMMHSQDVLGDGNTAFVSYDGRPERTPEDDELTTSTTTTVPMSSRSSKQYEGDSSIDTSVVSTSSSWRKTCEKVLERKEKQKVVFHMEGPLFDRLNRQAAATGGPVVVATSPATSPGRKIMSMTKTTPQHVDKKKKASSPQQRGRPTSPVSMEISVPAWQRRRAAHDAKATKGGARSTCTADTSSTHTSPEEVSPPGTPRRMFMV